MFCWLPTGIGWGDGGTSAGGVAAKTLEVATRRPANSIKEISELCVIVSGTLSSDLNNWNKFVTAPRRSQAVVARGHPGQLQAEPYR